MTEILNGPSFSRHNDPKKLINRTGLEDINVVQISINNDGTIIIADENTTIGYVVTDTSKDELSYLFVNPAFRCRGFGTLLLKEAEKMAGKNLFPAEPISPLGRKFFNHNSHVERDKNRTLESRCQQSVSRDLIPNE